MDFLDLIITIAILCVGGLLTGKKGKKTDPRQSAKQNRPVFEVPAADFSDEETEIGSERYGYQAGGCGRWCVGK